MWNVAIFYQVGSSFHPHFFSWHCFSIQIYIRLQRLFTMDHYYLYCTRVHPGQATPKRTPPVCILQTWKILWGGLGLQHVSEQSAGSCFHISESGACGQGKSDKFQGCKHIMFGSVHTWDKKTLLQILTCFLYHVFSEWQLEYLLSLPKL